jgi:hypothetical protein
MSGITARTPETYTVILHFAEAPWSLTAERTPYQFKVLGFMPGSNSKLNQWSIDTITVSPPLPRTTAFDVGGGRKALLALLGTALSREVGLDIRGLTWDRVAIDSSSVV